MKIKFGYPYITHQLYTEDNEKVWNITVQQNSAHLFTVTTKDRTRSLQLMSDTLGRKFKRGLVHKKAGFFPPLMILADEDGFTINAWPIRDFIGDFKTASLAAAHQQWLADDGYVYLPYPLQLGYLYYLQDPDKSFSELTRQVTEEVSCIPLSETWLKPEFND
jgi:hypothetical protein